MNEPFRGQSGGIKRGTREEEEEEEEEEIPWKREESWFTVFKVALMAISKKRLETGEQVPLPRPRCIPA